LLGSPGFQNDGTSHLIPDYEPPSASSLSSSLFSGENENSDPADVAQVILRLAASKTLPGHLVIGSDAVQVAGQAEAARGTLAGG
jgi:hypothetical protein